MSKRFAFSCIFRERRAYVGLTTFFHVDGSTLPAAISAVCTIYGLCLWNRSMVVIVKEGRMWQLRRFTAMIVVAALRA